MCITLGSGYVPSPSPSGSASTNSHFSIPVSVTALCNDWQSSSRTKMEEALRSRLICFFVKSPSNPQMDGSMAKSMSSEKRRITFHTLLRDVPPLNTRWSAIGNENTICNTAVTHKSFSTACTGKPVLLAVWVNTICCCSLDSWK